MIENDSLREIREAPIIQAFTSAKKKQLNLKKKKFVTSNIVRLINLEKALD